MPFSGMGPTPFIVDVYKVSLDWTSSIVQSDHGGMVSLNIASNRIVDFLVSSPWTILIGLAHLGFPSLNGSGLTFRAFLLVFVKKFTKEINFLC